MKETQSVNSSDEAVRARLRALTCKTLKIEPSVFHDGLGAGDLPQWDSIGQVTLLQAVEADLGLVFDVAEAIDIETFNDLVAAVVRAQATAS